VCVRTCGCGCAYMWTCGVFASPLFIAEACDEERMRKEPWSQDASLLFLLSFTDTGADRCKGTHPDTDTDTDTATHRHRHRHRHRHSNSHRHCHRKAPLARTYTHSRVQHALSTYPIEASHEKKQSQKQKKHAYRKGTADARYHCPPLPTPFFLYLARLCAYAYTFECVHAHV